MALWEGKEGGQERNLSNVKNKSYPLECLFLNGLESWPWRRVGRISLCKGGEGGEAVDLEYCTRCQRQLTYLLNDFSSSFFFNLCLQRMVAAREGIYSEIEVM